QLDLILSIVAIVLSIIFCIVIFAMKPEPVSPPAAPSIASTNLALPDTKGLVTYQNGLPGGGGTGGMGAGMGFGGPGAMGPGMMGGRPGAMGPGTMGRPGMVGPGTMGRPGAAGPGTMGAPSMAAPGRMGG
ncbi:MAG TPA: hypothetical protein VGE01_09225, partial [Fimbriimonas sp.]